jgi:hypothetical protein
MKVCELGQLRGPIRSTSSASGAFSAGRRSDELLGLAAACSGRGSDYTVDMSANELLEKVRALPLRERRKFFQGIHELEEGVATQQTPIRRKPVCWPDGAARRRKIFGDEVVPNLVLLAREEERF